MQIPVSLQPLDLLDAPAHDPNSGEDYYYPHPTLFEDLVVHEADRIARPETVLNRIVYDCNACMNEIGENGECEPYYKLQSENDSTLIFESRFERYDANQVFQISLNSKFCILVNIKFDFEYCV